MRWSDALLNRALDVVSARPVMDLMGRVSQASARRRHARYEAGRARMAALEVGTRADLARTLSVATDTTDAARALNEALAQL